MSNINEKQQQLVDKIKEMFQLDQPELDFGLYKIMHAKADQISAFIDNDLTAHIDNVFGEASSEDNQANLKKEKENIIASLGEAAFDEEGKLQQSYEQVPIVKPYLNALKASETDGGTLSNSASIYDHLYRFFSRYYDSGDFLSRRYHVAENAKRAAPYAVPYDGREVYLHWANKDQYYIKTSESFNSYTFDLSEAIKKERSSGELELGETSSNKKIHFQLVDADQGEHNNVKENQSRFFIIHAEQPVKLNDQEELILQFEYRVDPSKKGQNNIWQKKKLNEAEALILETLKSQTAYKDWYADLTTPAPTEKDKSRNILAKYLNQYSARNTMDYFIHKDLGGFLNRELDFYIKNEIMRLDDIEQSDATTVESWLLKVKVLRQVAKKVISFLAQLEDFQKKLWLKKKFVTETNYCMTLDRVPESFYKVISENKKQLNEWVELGFLDSESPGLTDKDLLENPGLIIDTGLFDRSFKERLLAEVDDLDETTDGVLIHSENFQALNLIEEKYQKQVDCIYIDPPYNTGTDGFPYKDNYQHSSWLTALSGRMQISLNLMNDTSACFISIDDTESHHLREIGEGVFGDENFISNIIWQKKYTRSNDAKWFSDNHDHILSFAKLKTAFRLNLLPRTEEQNKAYTNPDNHPKGAWKSTPLHAKSGNDNNFEFTFKNGITWAPPSGTFPRFNQETLSQLESEDAIWFGSDGTATPSRKSFLSEVKDGVTCTTIWGYKEVGHNHESVSELKSFFPTNPFANPKPSRLLKRIVSLVGDSSNVVLDYFAGSGTTAHATISLNREDNGNRKYILAEMGEYFDTVLKPRLKKVVYSERWKNGKPVKDEFKKYNGISHCFKYNRLESYEDSINNLVMNNQIEPKIISNDYLLNYWLDTETAESPSLLNISQFKDPTNYHLSVKNPGSDERVDQPIDLIETFNWLIGLRVEELDKWRSYEAEFIREKDPELPGDQNTRLIVKSRKERDAYSDEAGEYHLRMIEGWCCRNAGDESIKDKVLIIWRKLTDDLEKDAALLESILDKKKVNQADSEYDLVYINGSHGLQLRGDSKSRLMNLEETFMAKMWEDAV